MFSKYYQSELSLPAGDGHGPSALANPALAGLLVERGGGPGRGAAAGGLRVPDRAHPRAHGRRRARGGARADGAAAAALPAPAARRAPSWSSPRMRACCAAARGIPAGAEVASKPVDGTTCVFRTTADVDLLPLTLQDAAAGPARPRLARAARSSSRRTEQGRGGVFQRARALRLFIHGGAGRERAAAAVAAAPLPRGAGARGRRRETASAARPPSASAPVGFDAGLPAAAVARRAPEGYRLLQEYFTLPQKFLFFEVRGLEAAASVIGGAVGARSSSSSGRRRWPARVPKDIFRLHCAPVINLFRAPADPVCAPARWTTSTWCGPPELDPQHMEVYSVDAVTGLQAGRSERRTYRPFFDFAHATGEEPSGLLPAAPGSSPRRRRHRHLPRRWGRRATWRPRSDRGDALHRPHVHQPLAARAAAGGRHQRCPRRRRPPWRVQATSSPVTPPGARRRSARSCTGGCCRTWPSTSARSRMPPRCARLLDLYNFQATGGQPRRPRQPPAHQGHPHRGVPAPHPLPRGRSRPRGNRIAGGRRRDELHRAWGMPSSSAAVLDELLASHVSLNSFNELAPAPTLAGGVLDGSRGTAP